MATKMYTDDEVRQAAEMLRKVFPKGSTITTMTRWVNRGGDSHRLTVFAVIDDVGGTHEAVSVSWAVARVIGRRYHPGDNSVICGGGGVHHGHGIARDLGRALYGDVEAFRYATIS
jgi:hypothetical protein